MTLNPEKDLIKMYAVQILKMKPIILINNSSYKIPLILNSFCQQNQHTSLPYGRMI